MTLPLIPLEGGGYTPPGTQDFIWPGLIPGLDWANKPFFQAVIGALLVILLWVIASRRLKVVPSKGQFVSEYFYDFVRNGIARDILGPDYRKYLPYLLGLFSFILVNNWFGQFFFFMYPAFSNVGYAYGLALLTLVIYIGAGIKKHGLGKYLKQSLIPEGVPFYLYPLIIPLEFLSNFITRPITLSLRLFANLFAGHLVVMVFVVGGWFLMTYPSQSAGDEVVPFFNVAGVISVLFSFAILFLELFIGALQAYIFTVLTAQYVSSSLAEAH
ncbi:MAG: F0F1 ATP synthase subunit A [Propionibacterium sp.]|nr:F0F1 ATP synthase subunit A [Propionibacterium sp.]